MTHVPDLEQRRNAILADGHAFVWAGAGTGKTHTLTLRALYLLLNIPFQASPDGSRPLLDLYRTNRTRRLAAARRVIRSLVLTTFTRKAAAEMQSRLFGYLDRLSQDQASQSASDPLFGEVVSAILKRLVSRLGSDPEARLAAGAQTLVETASEMQISTLHSMASSLLRRHPLEAGIAPDLIPSDDDEDSAKEVAERLIRQWWRTRALKDARIEADLNEALRSVSVGQLESWFIQALRHPWLRCPDPGPAAPLEESLEACRALMQRLGAERPIFPEWVRFARLVSRPPGDHEALELSRLIETRHRRLFEPDQVRRAVQSLPEVQRRFFTQPSLLQRAFAFQLLEGSCQPSWRAFRRLILDFASWSDHALTNELRTVTFDEVIRMAVRLLRTHPEVRRQERDRLASLLVDEFQDTDPDQLRLICELLRRRQGDSEVLGFFVGDTKQSIYRFRGADLEALQRFRSGYQALTECVKPPEEFRLTTSFRSLPQVTRFINRFFEEVIPLAKPEEALVAFRGEARGADGAPQAEEVRSQMDLPFRRAAKPDSSRQPAWIWIESDEATDARTARLWAARSSAQCIQDLRAEGFGYGEILVLVRKEREIEPMLDRLEKREIPYVSGGAKTFLRRPEVLDLLNLMILLHHPADSLAAAAVLRSPLVGLDDPLVHRLRHTIADGSLLHGDGPLPDQIPRRPASRIEEIRRLVRRRKELSALEWLEEVRDFFPLAPYLERGHQGRPAARVRRLLEDFRRRLGKGSSPPLVWLLEQRGRASRGDRFDADLGEDVALADETVDAVRVLTIHKAKGLESRAVIVCGWQSVLSDLTGQFPSAPPSVVSSSQGAGGAFRLPWGRLLLESANYRRAVEEEMRRNRDEARRLAYVAATRACERLILISAPHPAAILPSDLDEWVKRILLRAQAVGPRSSVEICGGSGRFRLVDPPRRTAPQRPKAQSTLDRSRHRALWRQRPWSIPQQPLWRSPTDAEGPEVEDGFPTPVENGLRSPAPPGLQRQTGLLVHRYLERHLAEARFDRVRLEALAAEADYQPESLARSGAILEEFFNRRLCHPDGESYLDRLLSARILSRELPVYLEVDGEAWYGILDLVLERGRRILAVDYKATPPLTPLPPEQQRQERIYSEALHRLYPDRPVDFEFWWLG